MIRVLIKAYRNDCVVQNTLSNLNIDFNIIRININGDEATHLVSINRMLTDDHINALRDARLKVTRINEDLMWIKAPVCSSCRVLGNSGALVNEGSPLNDNVVVYEVLLPSRGYLRSVMREFTRNGVNAKIMMVENVKLTNLTRRQLEVLQLAYRRGLFNGKRRVSISDLARELNITPATLSILLRKSIKKCLKFTSSTYPVVSKLIMMS